MNYPTVVNVHKLLHRGKVGEIKRSVGKDYLQVDHGDLSFITQNMKKKSSNTSWIKEDPDHRRITWIFKQGIYDGEIREFRDEDKQVIEVYRLKPARHLVYREEERIAKSQQKTA